MATLNESRGIVANYDAKVAEARAGANPDDAASLKKASETIATLTAEYNAAKDHLAMAEQFASTGQPTRGNTAISEHVREAVRDDSSGGFETVEKLASAVADYTAGNRPSPQIAEKIGVLRNPDNGAYRFPLAYAAQIAGPQSQAAQILRTRNAAAGQTTQVGSLGGLGVIPTYVPDYAPRARLNPIHPFVRTILNGSSQLILPRFKDNTNASGKVAGNVRAYWKAEGGATTISSADYEQTKIDLHELGCLAAVTYQMLKSMPDVGRYMMENFATAYSQLIDDAIIRGTGAGQALGILNSTNANKTTVTRTTANRVKIEDIGNMIAKGAAAGQTVWLMPNSFRGQAVQMLAGQNLAFTPIGQFGNANPYDMIQGSPVCYTDYTAALGSENDVILLNAYEYILAVLGSPEYGESLHFYFNTGETAFRLLTSAGGSLFRNKPFTAANGEIRYDVVGLAA